MKEKFAHLRRDLPVGVSEISLLSSNNPIQISLDLGLGLDLSEMNAIKQYFIDKGMEPTDIELQTFGQTWSEHCIHKTFKGDIVTDNGIITHDLGLIVITHIVRAKNSHINKSL